MKIYQRFDNGFRLGEIAMENKLIYSSEANCFEKALPLGNGSLGATVYGRCGRERISLNHDTLWSGKPRLIKNDKAKNAFFKIRQLVLEKQYANKC